LIPVPRYFPYDWMRFLLTISAYNAYYQHPATANAPVVGSPPLQVEGEGQSPSVTIVPLEQWGNDSYRGLNKTNSSEVPPPVLMPEKENVLWNALVCGVVSTALGALVGEVSWQIREDSLLSKKIRYAEAFKTLIPETLTLKQQKNLYAPKGLIETFKQLIEDPNTTQKSLRYNDELLAKLAPWLEKLDDSKKNNVSIEKEFTFYTDVKKTFPKAFQDIMIVHENKIVELHKDYDSENETLLEYVRRKNRINSSNKNESVNFIVNCFEALLATARKEEETLLEAIRLAKQHQKKDLGLSEYAFPTPKEMTTAFQWFSDVLVDLPLINANQKEQLLEAAGKAKRLFIATAFIGTVLGSIVLHFMTKRHNQKVAESNLKRQQLAQEPLVNVLRHLDETLDQQKPVARKSASVVKTKRPLPPHKPPTKPSNELSFPAPQTETVQAFWEKRLRQ
jgi:hypothetical protein